MGTNRGAEDSGNWFLSVLFAGCASSEITVLRLEFDDFFEKGK